MGSPRFPRYLKAGGKPSTGRHLPLSLSVFALFLFGCLAGLLLRFVVGVRRFLVLILLPLLFHVVCFLSLSFLSCPAFVFVVAGLVLCLYLVFSWLAFVILSSRCLVLCLSVSGLCFVFVFLLSCCFWSSGGRLGGGLGPFGVVLGPLGRSFGVLGGLKNR